MRTIPQRVALFAFSAAALLPGCIAFGEKVSNPKSRILDGGLISQIPCGAPCFWGITPGDTSFDEARVTLEKAGLPCVELDTFGTVDLSCNLPGEGYMRGLGWIGVGLDQSIGLVSSVGFGPSIEVDTSDVLDVYGPPDLLFIYAEGRPEYPLVDASFVFQEIRAVLALPYEEGFSFTIDEEDDVISVYYYDTAKFSELLAVMEHAIQAWNGYGRYEP